MLLRPLVFICARKIGEQIIDMDENGCRNRAKMVNNWFEEVGINAI